MYYYEKVMKQKKLKKGNVMLNEYKLFDITGEGKKGLTYAEVNDNKDNKTKKEKKAKKYIIDREGSKKNKKAKRLISLLMAFVMLGSVLLAGCGSKKVDNTNSTTAVVAYQKEDNMISALKAKLKEIAPEMTDEKITDTALILTLNLIAQKDENGKIKYDIMDHFKNKVDTDSMMDNFNSFEDVIETNMITENKFVSVAATLPDELKEDREILGYIEQITKNIMDASIRGDKETVNSEFNKIYTLFVDEDKLTIDGTEFEVRDLSYSVRSIAEAYARCAAYYGRNYVKEDKLNAVDKRTNQQNNKAYIKEMLAVMANGIDEVSDTAVVDEFNAKYASFEQLLNGKINTSAGNQRDLVNYINLKYLESTHVSTKDKNTILNDYDEKQIDDTILTIDSITKYNETHQTEMVLFSSLLVKDYLNTDTGKTDKLALDFIQYNSMMLLKDKESIKDFTTIFNNPYFKNIYMYFTKQDLTYRHKVDGKVVDDLIAWQDISDGTNFVNNEIIIYTLKQFPHLKADFENYGFIEKTQTNLTESVQYVQNVLTGECQKTDYQYVK